MGSFDPIHVGHIAIVNEVINSNLVDKVFIIPTMQNPWKKGEPPLSFETRINLIKLSIEPFGDKVEVLDVEKNINPPFYSYKTINILNEMFPNDKLFVIAGTDVANNMPMWKNWNQEIKDKVGVICVKRNGIEPTVDLSNFPLGISAIDVEITKAELSSTMVRNLAREGKVLYPYVNEKVNDFILKNGLYIKK